MALPYLESFLDSLEPLPAELQRNFTLMKDLDTRTQDVIHKISKESDDYMTNVNDLKPEEKCSRFKNIHEMFEKAKVISDDKVQLASQTYEMVDKHIRKLDSELARLESEMKEKQVHLSAEEASSSKGNRKKKDVSKNKSKVNPKSVFESKDVKKKAILVADHHPPMLPLLASGTEVLDMPVDPNEPTYCICHQVSYGEMIGCDNIDCTIEWFHFGCVGLTMKPKGKWFCPKCTNDRKKK